MNNCDNLVEALRKHKSDYDEGRTQNFYNICCDCKAAADVIDSLTAELYEEIDRISWLRLRLEHLLISETIRDYDERDSATGTYARDIRTLDVQMKRLDEFIRAERDRDECNNVAWDEAALGVLYVCDRRKCNTCNPECMHTEDVRHAKNFEVAEYGNMIMEREG